MTPLFPRPRIAQSFQSFQAIIGIQTGNGYRAVVGGIDMAFGADGLFWEEDLGDLADDQDGVVGADEMLLGKLQADLDAAFQDVRGRMRFGKLRGQAGGFEFGNIFGIVGRGLVSLVQDVLVNQIDGKILLRLNVVISMAAGLILLSIFKGFPSSKLKFRDKVHPEARISRF